MANVTCTVVNPIETIETSTVNLTYINSSNPLSLPSRARCSPFCVQRGRYRPSFCESKMHQLNEQRIPRKRKKPLITSMTAREKSCVKPSLFIDHGWKNNMHEVIRRTAVSVAGATRFLRSYLRRLWRKSIVSAIFFSREEASIRLRCSSARRTELP